ncbi:MAG: hypothetical protein ACREIC_19110, partial [Limisphaerales bacterium]
MLLLLMIAAAVQLVRQNWATPAINSVEGSQTAVLLLDGSKTAPEPDGIRSRAGTERQSANPATPEDPCA